MFTGKLDLYCAAAGFHPGRVMPCVIDVGTDNEALRNDPMYMGLQHPRLQGDAYFEVPCPVLYIFLQNSLEILLLSVAARGRKTLRNPFVLLFCTPGSGPSVLFGSFEQFPLPAVLLCMMSSVPADPYIFSSSAVLF